MKRILIFCLSIVVFATFLYSKKLNQEGREWLQQNSKPAEININGKWFSEDWGMVVLVQKEGSREISGDGDGWKVDGVVSGKAVLLLFTESNGDIGYSARLDAEQEDTLKGSYSRGIMDGTIGDREMFLTRKSRTVVQPVSEELDKTAGIVIYRKKGLALASRGVDPPIYLDDRQLVWMDNGRYFNIRITPEEHWITSSNEDKPVKISANIGEIYYIEVNLSGDGVMKKPAWKNGKNSILPSSGIILLINICE